MVSQKHTKISTSWKCRRSRYIIEAVDINVAKSVRSGELISTSEGDEGRTQAQIQTKRILSQLFRSMDAQEHEQVTVKSWAPDLRNG